MLLAICALAALVQVAGVLDATGMRRSTVAGLVGSRYRRIFETF